MATINGYVHDYSSIELSVNGQTFNGVSSIEYTQSMERTGIYGTGPKVIGFTRGQLSLEGSLEMYKEDYDALAASITNLADSSLSITVTYSNPGSPITTDVLAGVKLNSIGNSHSAGTDGLVVSLGFVFGAITSNGKDLYAADSALDKALALAGASASLINRLS